MYVRCERLTKTKVGRNQSTNKRSLAAATGISFRRYVPSVAYFCNNKTCIFGNDAATDNAIAIHDIIHPSRSKTNECIITIENNYSFFLFLQPDSLEKGFLIIGFTSR